MSDAWHSAQIEQFEHVEAGPSAALLRVVARPDRWSPNPPARPVLIADDRRQVRRFDPLPAPADAGGVLRAAYSVPREAVAPHTRFSLQLADGEVLQLPGPTAGVARREPAEGQAGPDQAEEAPALRERAAEAEAALEKTRAAMEELEVWSGELERRLADAATELGAAQARLRDDERELEDLRHQVSEAEARAQLAEDRVQALEEQLRLAEGVSPNLAELSRRAAERASAVAARELNQAFAEGSRPGSDTG